MTKRKEEEGYAAMHSSMIEDERQEGSSKAKDSEKLRAQEEVRVLISFRFSSPLFQGCFPKEDLELSIKSV